MTSIITIIDGDHELCFEDPSLERGVVAWSPRYVVAKRRRRGHRDDTQHAKRHRIDSFVVYDPWMSAKLNIFAVSLVHDSRDEGELHARQQARGVVDMLNRMERTRLSRYAIDIRKDLATAGTDADKLQAIAWKSIPSGTGTVSLFDNDNRMISTMMPEREALEVLRYLAARVNEVLRTIPSRQRKTA